MDEDKQILQEVITNDEDFTLDIYNDFNPEFVTFINDTINNTIDMNLIYESIEVGYNKVIENNYNKDSEFVEQTYNDISTFTNQPTDIQNNEIKEYETLSTKNEAEAEAMSETNKAKNAMKNIEKILENIANDPTLTEEERQEKQKLFSAVIAVANNEDSSPKSIQQAKDVFEQHINDIDSDYKYSNLVNDVNAIKEELEATADKDLNKQSDIDMGK